MLGSIVKAIVHLRVFLVANARKAESLGVLKLREWTSWWRGPLG